MDDLTEAAVELTIQQSADILAVRRRRDELAERAGGLAALLRSDRSKPGGGLGTLERL